MLSLAEFHSIITATVNINAPQIDEIVSKMRDIAGNPIAFEDDFSLLEMIIKATHT